VAKPDTVVRKIHQGDGRVGISKRTGKPYRLLSEAEWEYVARAGTTTAYSWGDEIGRGNANCKGCGSQWDEQTALVDSFAANTFGLYDMHGNVYEWVEDCVHGNYTGAPTDGSAWDSGDCSRRVLRGGSWLSGPWFLRSASRSGYTAVYRYRSNGFRLGRTLP
jgi:formylglycine-generating enzyme required for sulfatase activity